MKRKQMADKTSYLLNDYSSYDYYPSLQKMSYNNREVILTCEWMSLEVVKWNRMSEIHDAEDRIGIKKI